MRPESGIFTGQTESQAVQSVQMAQQAGFENVSVDLMLGTPGQGRQSVEHFVSTFAQLGVQHISGYLLKIELREVQA